MDSVLASSSQLQPIDVAYRPGTPADAARIALLLQNHYNWINVNHSPFAVIHRRTSEESIRESIAGLPVIVAEVDGIVIGFATTRPQEPSVMELRNVYVDDSYRGQGIGHELLERIEGQVLEQGFAMMMATASSRWYPNKPLPTKVFAGCGYTVTELDEQTELYLKKLTVDVPSEEAETEDDKVVTAIRHITYRDEFNAQF